MISKWLSYFSFESGIKKERSLDILKILNQKKPEILNGKNIENLTLVIKLLENFNSNQTPTCIFQESNDKIKTIFEKTKNDTNFHHSGKITEAKLRAPVWQLLFLTFSLYS